MHPGLILFVLAATRPWDPPTPTSAPPADLRWEGPQGCEDEGNLFELVEHLAGGPVSTEDDPPRVEAVVTRREDDFFDLRLVFEREGVYGEETLTAASCDALRQVVALKLALALSPIAVAQRVAAPSVEPPEPAAAEPEPVAVVEVKEATVTPRVRKRPGFGVRAEGVVGFGALPEIAPGVSVALGVHGRAWRAELAGFYFAPQDLDVRDTSGGSVRFQMGLAAARGCAVPRLDPVEFPLCLGVEAGAIRAEGIGLQVNRTVHEPRAAVTVGPALAWRIHPGVALWLGAEAGVALMRSGFVVEEVGRVHRTEFAEIRGLLGVEARVL